MSARSGSRDLMWTAAGALGIMIFFFAFLYLRKDRDPAVQIAFKAKRVQLVTAMRLSLATASEAQNGAVMSTAEQDSKSFADQARAATADLDRGRVELQQLLKEHSDPHEVELMDRVAHTLGEFQQIDKQLLELAVQNSNRKAYSMAFGPAMKLLHEIDEPLSRIVAAHADSQSENNMKVQQLASEVRIGVLRMQVLLLPHIAEASDEKMDKLEVQVSEEDRKVRENMASLNVLLPESEKANIATATSHYAEFGNLRSQIIKLSRQNTDLRAVAIALKERRKAMLACQDALVALQNAIQAEPISTTIPAGR